MEQRYWIAVASSDHVAVGVEAGIVQIAHGKRAPLHRMSVGDGIIYYSPRRTLSRPSSGENKLQMFTAVGVVTGEEVYQVDMGNDFRPYRRIASYVTTQPLPLGDVKEKLAFTRYGANPGAALRFGFLQISAEDFWLIAGKMADEEGRSRLQSLMSGVEHF